MSLVREVRLVRGVDGRLRLSQRPVLPAEVAVDVGEDLYLDLEQEAAAAFARD